MPKVDHKSSEGGTLRVIMVTPCYYPVKGGTEIVVQNLSTLLNESGVHTDVMTFNMDRKWYPKCTGKKVTVEGITVFKVPALNWLPIRHSPKITLGINLIPGRFRHIFKDYDIIHFHEADFSFPLFSVPVKKPKIFHLHGIDADFLKRYHPSRFILKHSADLYISISKQMSKDLTALGIDEEKIAYLPNAVDTKLFSPKKGKENNLVLFVGRIEPNKGLHVLINSLRYLKKPIHLVIIGPVTWSRDYFQDLFDKNIKRINQEGTHEITYLGPLNHKDIVEWYQKASILAFPSFSEAFGVVLLEALACGTPVISTPVGGIPDIVQNHENGILVPPNNSLKLADAIQYLLDNKDIRTKMSKEGRKWVVKNFSLDVIINRLCGIYQNILNQYSQ